MNKLKYSQEKLNEIVKKSKNYSFCALLLDLRKALGISRREVASDLQIPYHRIFVMETGMDFSSHLEGKTLEKLANYYGISSTILAEKALEAVHGKL